MRRRNVAPSPLPLALSPASTQSVLNARGSSPLALGRARVARTFAQWVGLAPVARRTTGQLATRRLYNWSYDTAAPGPTVADKLPLHDERVVRNRRIPVQPNQCQRIRTFGLRVPVEQISHPSVVHPARQTGRNEPKVRAESSPPKKTLKGDDAGAVKGWREGRAAAPHQST